MVALPVSKVKQFGDTLKGICRLISKPFLPVLPSSLLNRFPFMGQVCINGPEKNWQIRFQTHGKQGKDRIAIKLARRGLAGYEGETTRVFSLLAKESKTIIDIGANTGLFALIAATINPHSQVWAFEPVPFIFNMLKNNVLLNELTNLQIEALAVGDSTGLATFYVTRTSVGIPTDSSLCPGFRDNVDQFTVPMMTLDDYAKKYRLPKIDLLKIDTETTESKVIQGALGIIEKDQPFIICEVLKNINHAYLQEALHVMRYHFFHITPKGLHQHPHLQGSLEGDKRNYLFVPITKTPSFYHLCDKAQLSVFKSPE